MKNVVVVFGGSSEEREVSLVTGIMTANALRCDKYNPIPVFADENGTWFTGKNLFDISLVKRFGKKGLNRVTLPVGEPVLYEIKKNGKLKKIVNVDCAINCMHGKPGEDGSLAGVFNASFVPFASPDLFSSALAMNKSVCSEVLRKFGFPCADGIVVSKKDFFRDSDKEKDRIKRFGFPIIVKPASNGSSVGITVVKDYDEKKLSDALFNAFFYDEVAVVERFLTGYSDVNCAAVKLSDETITSRVEKITKKGDYFTFEDKYSGDGKGVSKSGVDEATSEKIKQMTKEIYDTFSFDGIVRIDFLVKEKDVKVNEINAVPGSMAYYLFVDKISEFTKLLTDLLDYTIKKYASEKRKTTNTFKLLDFSSFTKSGKKIGR